MRSFRTVLAVRSSTLRLVVAASWVVLGACQSVASLGATCSVNGDCTSPLVCRLGRCRTECAANRDCPVGARCLLDQGGAGSCSIAPDDACRAGECPSPLLCVEGRCRNLCGGTTLCADGNDCVSQPAGDVCVEQSSLDGGPLDGGPLDAGPADVGPGDAGPPANGVVDACVGERHVCAVSAHGHVWCWGFDDEGQLGDAAAAHPECMLMTVPCSSAPVEVVRHDGTGPLEGAVQVGCGDDHACARLGTGEVYCWGREFSGLGTDDFTGQGILAAVRAEVGGVTELVAGRTTTCARSGADWYCWGENGHGAIVDGRLGDPTYTEISSSIARLIPTFHAVDHLALATWATCWAVGVEVRCVGLNDVGELGIPADGLGYPTPPIVLRLPAPVTAITAGDDLFCTLDASGMPSCWGNSDHCGLGRDTPPDPEVPALANTTVWRTVVGGVETHHFCGIRVADGTVACWGNNGDGQSGTTGSATCAPTSVMRSDATVLVADDLALGGASCAITPTHELWCWGPSGVMLQQAPVSTPTPTPTAMQLVVPE